MMPRYKKPGRTDGAATHAPKHPPRLPRDWTKERKSFPIETSDPGDPEDGYINARVASVPLLLSTPWVRSVHRADPLSLIPEAQKEELLALSDYKTAEELVFTASDGGGICEYIEQFVPNLCSNNVIPEGTSFAHHVFSMDSARYYVVFVVGTTTGTYDAHYYLSTKVLT